MKKNNLIEKAMAFLVPLALSASMLMAQSNSKKNAQDNTSAKKQQSQELKVKYEANGLTYNTPVAKPSGARQCTTNAGKTISIKRSSFDHFSPKAQELIKNHPEKYVVVD